MKARGYGIFELNNVLYRQLEPGGPTVRVPAGVRIRPGKPEEAGQFSDIVSRSFFEKGDAPEGFADMLAPLFRFPGSLTFVASVDENPVAAGAGRIIPEHRVFALFGAGTLPEFRGRAALREFFTARSAKQKDYRLRKQLRVLVDDTMTNVLKQRAAGWIG